MLPFRRFAYCIGGKIKQTGKLTAIFKKTPVDRWLLQTFSYQKVDPKVDANSTVGHQRVTNNYTEMATW